MKKSCDLRLQDFVSIVETAGIEPASEKQDQGLSTSLVCLYFLVPEFPGRQGNPGTSR